MGIVLLIFVVAIGVAVGVLLDHHNATLNDWLMGLFTYAIAVATVLALFQDWLRSQFWHPKLDVTIEPVPPDSHKTAAYRPDPGDPDILVEGSCFYYRLRVHNRGSIAAKSVEIYVTNVEHRVDGNWMVYEKFIPQYLVWSLLDRAYSLPNLPPKSFRHCDLGHVFDPAERHLFGPTEHDYNVPGNETIFCLDVHVQALRRGHLLPPGEYRISIEVAAANVEPSTFTVVVRNPGNWFENEGQMLQNGIRAFLVDAAGNAVQEGEIVVSNRNLVSSLLEWITP